MSDESEVSNANQIMVLSSSFDSKQYIRDIKAAVINGDVNPLQVNTVMKRMEKISKEFSEDKEIKKLVLDEADKYFAGNTKTVELWSAKIIKSVVHTSFDFKDCGHIEYDEIVKIITKLEERKKVIEEELKLLIPKETTQINLEANEEFGIPSDSKEVIISQMPQLTWLKNEDQITVKAPKKYQLHGLKYMKI